MSNYSNNIKEKMGEAIDSAIEKLSNMSEEEFLNRLKGCDDEMFEHALSHGHVQDPALIRKISEAQDSVLEELNKMSDEELLSNLENCGDSSIAYAIFPELGDDS